MKNSFRNNFPIVNLYKKKSLRSIVDSQLIYGDNFRIIKKYIGWNKIKNNEDGYIGYIKNRQFSKPIKPNFKVSVLKANLFRGPSPKKKLNKYLPYNSRIRIIKKKGKFGKFGNIWIKISDLKKNTFRYKNIFKDVKLFKNTRYLWGGKSYKGIDCSALVQIFFNNNNKYCPRDSRDQERYFKKKVKLKNIKKNDMIFWKGHVAVAISKNKLIHAYGPLKKVVVMDTKKTIDRIYRTASLEVTSVRRP